MEPLPLAGDPPPVQHHQRVRQPRLGRQGRQIGKGTRRLGRRAAPQQQHKNDPAAQGATEQQ